ncbi:hypothetical protein H0194_07065 [Corynebacterium incognita]|uniref:Uncharacterized protein n=1 Tax=Corynebacterium incognita TaxID=2754725 RepID=A0A7G7CMN0_9CORY|nr:hypothetical protein [Corynebacterium incognita]QNE88846.1 hypothetical protein H0194_07065 [Corynebacterium incognita]
MRGRGVCCGAGSGGERWGEVGDFSCFGATVGAAGSAEARACGEANAGDDGAPIDTRCAITDSRDFCPTDTPYSGTYAGPSSGGTRAAEATATGGGSDGEEEQGWDSRGVEKQGRVPRACGGRQTYLAARGADATFARTESGAGGAG